MPGGKNEGENTGGGKTGKTLNINNRRVEKIKEMKTKRKEKWTNQVGKHLRLKENLSAKEEKSE